MFSLLAQLNTLCEKDGPVNSRDKRTEKNDVRNKCILIETDKITIADKKSNIIKADNFQSLEICSLEINKVNNGYVVLTTFFLSLPKICLFRVLGQLEAFMNHILVDCQHTALIPAQFTVYVNTLETFFIDYIHHSVRASRAMRRVPCESIQDGHIL
jgi:hypothetical protein